jgi:hypothetical protein
MDDDIVRAKQGVNGTVPKITQGYKVCCAEEIQSLTFSGRPQDHILLTSKNKFVFTGNFHRFGYFGSGN